MTAAGRRPRLLRGFVSGAAVVEALETDAFESTIQELPSGCDWDWGASRNTSSFSIGDDSALSSLCGEELELEDGEDCEEERMRGVGALETAIASVAETAAVLELLRAACFSRLWVVGAVVVVVVVDAAVVGVELG